MVDRILSAEDAVEWAEEERRLFLFVLTSPEDITGMKAAQGILDSSWYDISRSCSCSWNGIHCVSGCGDIAMDEENKKFTLTVKSSMRGDALHRWYNR